MVITALSILLLLLVHDAGVSGYVFTLPIALTVALVVIPRLMLLSLYRLSASVARHRLLAHQSRATRGHQWFSHVLYACVPLFFAMDLTIGSLVLLRGTLGDWVGIDEALILLPTLLYLMAIWWIDDPLEQICSSATLLRRLDQGETIENEWSRPANIWRKVRMTLATIAVPAWLLLSMMEFADRFVPERFLGLAILGAIVIMQIAGPSVLIRVLDVRSMAAGETRDAVLALAKQSGLVLRDVMLWRTGGRMANAAVVGPIRGTRRVLLSDALLNAVDDDQLQAIVAHELGHLKHRHFITHAGATMALFGLPFVIGLWLESRGHLTLDPAPWIIALIIVFGGALWYFVAGAVVKLAEREADASAVAQISKNEKIDALAIAAMTGALHCVVRLNGQPVDKADWMHDSVNDRCAMLRGHADKSFRETGPSRAMTRLRRSVLLLCTVTGLIWWLAR